MSSNFIRSLTNYIVDNTMVKKISMIPTQKLVIYTGVGSLSMLGFYRGCQEYFYRKFKYTNGTITSSDYLCWPIFGLISASLYVNPAISGFAFYYEYERIKMLLSDDFDEKAYYINPYLSVYNDEKILENE